MIKYILLFVSILLPSVALCAPSISGTSGTAPYIVHCSAGLEASDGVGVDPNLDYVVTWTFGDTNAGTWAHSGKSKNTEQGIVAAHVFDTPGTYTVTVTIKDVNGNVVSGVGSGTTFSVEVTSANSAFSGTNTLCYSTSGDFTGCPSGASQVTTSNINSINFTGGRRYLFKRGESWTASALLTGAASSTRKIIGAYGTCTGLNAMNQCSNDPVINTQYGLFNDDNHQNVTLQNLRVNGAIMLSGSGINIRNWLIYRCYVDANYTIGTPLGWTHYNNYTTDLIDMMAVVETTSRRGRENNAYFGSKRLINMGNHFEYAGNSHSWRVWQAYQGVLTHNLSHSASSDYNLVAAREATRGACHALKLHGCTEVTECRPARAGSIDLEFRTQEVVVADNVFGQSGPWPVAIGPADAGQDSRQTDIIFENNKILSGLGSVSYRSNGDGTAYEEPGQYSLEFSMKHSVVRNNIMDATSPGAMGGIQVWHRYEGNSDFPANVRILNNTIYKGDYTADFAGIVIDEAAGGNIMRNNLVVSPLTTNLVAIQNNSVAPTASNNVATKLTGYFTDVATSTYINRLYTLTSSATLAIDAGYAGTVYTDFTGAVRTGTMDVGAFSYPAESGDSTITCYQDADNDGYGHGEVEDDVESCSNGYYIASHFTALTGDCNDNNANIKPGATDVCGNGIDEDCSGSDASCVAGGMAIGVGSTRIDTGTTRIVTQ